MSELSFGEKLLIARKQLDLYSYQMAELLGVHPNTLRSRIKRMGLKRDDEASPIG